MGWLSWNCTRRQMIEHLTKNRNYDSGGSCETLRHCMRGNNLWAKMKHTDKDGNVTTFICLFLLRRVSASEWAYKDIDETAGPGYANCPLSYLDGLSEPTGYAKDFRERVKKYWADRRKLP